MLTNSSLLGASAIRRPSLLFLCFCSLTLSVFSQASWKPLGGPQGTDQIIEMTAGPSGEYYLANQRAIFRSLDGGASWAEIPVSAPSFQPNWLGLDVLPDGTVLAWDYGWLYQLEPGGSQFTILLDYATTPLPDFLRFLRHTPGGRLIGWDPTADQLLKSDNGGSSWETLYAVSLGDPDRLVVHGGSSNYLVDEFKVIQFEEDGSAQKEITFSLSPPAKPTMGFEYLPDKNLLLRASFAYLATSSNGGDTWTQLPLPSTQQDFSGLAYDLAGGRILLGMGDTIWTTANLGSDWDVFFAMPANSLYSPGFAATFGPTGKMLLRMGHVCAPASLLRSDNGGQSWIATDPLFREEDTYEFISDHAGHLYARSCDVGSLWRHSTDGGQSWKTLRAAPDETAFEGLFCTREGVLFGQDQTGKGFRSENHGSTWVPCGSFPTDIQFFEGGDGAIYAISPYGGEGFVSTDLGKSWTSLGILPYLFSFMPYPDGSLYRYLYFGFANLLQRSFDHGFTWVDVPNNPISTSVELPGKLLCSASGVLFLYTTKQSEIVVSTDGSQSWFPIASPPLLRHIDIDVAGNLYGAASSLNLLFSYDANTQAWKQWTTPLDGALLTCTVDRDQHLLIGGTHGNLYRTSSSVASAGVVRGLVSIQPDCSDPGAAPQPGWLVKAKNTADGSTFFTATSVADSMFRFLIPKGNYQLSLAQQNAFYPICGPAQTIAVPSPDTVALRREKAAASCPYLRVVSSNQLLRRCFENEYQISWCNDGTAGATDARLDVTLDSFFEFVSAGLPVSSVTGKTLRFDLGTLPPNECGSMKLRVKINCDAPPGQLHCLTSHIFPDALCLPGLDTTAVYRECAENRGSFDPNDKTAFRNGREEKERYAKDEPLEFLIRFQNTGTDTAFRVVVEDRLSNLFDAGTFRPLQASHPYRWELTPDYLRGEHVARFIFDPIALPDSNVNEAASHGFVKFEIRPQASGQVLENYADIYFDYNPPVRTNTVQLSYTSGVSSAAAIPEVKIRPQPFHDRAEASFDFSGPCRFELFDAQGRLLRQDVAVGGRYVIRRGQLPAGLYFCRFVRDDGRIVAAGKLVAE